MGPRNSGMLEVLKRSLRQSLAHVVPALVPDRSARPVPARMSQATLGAFEPTLPPWPCSTERVAGARLNVRRTTRAGQPGVVYVHGLGGSATNFTDVQGALAPHTEGAAVDLPGFGFSEPARDFDFRLDSHARVLREYLVGLGGPVHLVGNSMGGAIALLTALERPDLVRSLTLVSPAMPDRRPDPRRLADPRLPLAYLPVIGRPVRRKLAELGPRERARQVIELCFADPGRLSAARLDDMAAELTAVELQKWVQPALVRSTLDMFRTWLRFGEGSLWSAARAVTVPALVVWGEQDKLVSVSRAVRTASALPRGRLLLLPDTGHVAQMEHPASVARAVLGMWEDVEACRW